MQEKHDLPIQVTTNVYYDDDQRCIYASARGPYEEDNELLKIMWMTLKPAFNCITATLSEYPGIVYSVSNTCMCSL